MRRVIDAKGKKGKTGKAKQTGKGTTAIARTAVKKPAAAAPMPPRDPHATQMKSAQPRESTRPDSVVTLPDFDALERAAKGVMSLSAALHRLISQNASDESMALFKEVHAGRAPRKLPPATTPELRQLLPLHRIVSKILTPVVTRKVRLTLMRLVDAVGPSQGVCARAHSAGRGGVVVKVRLVVVEGPGRPILVSPGLRRRT